MSDYSRRNERARADGWKSYGEQRQAKAKGYGTTGEYRAARQASGRRPTPINPLQPIAKLPGGGEVARLPGKQTGIHLPPGTDPKGLYAYLSRFRADRRVSIWLGNFQVGGKRGFSRKFITDHAKDWQAENGKGPGWEAEWFGDFLEEFGGGYEGDAGGGGVSVTVT